MNYEIIQQIMKNLHIDYYARIINYHTVYRSFTIQSEN